MVAQGSNTGGGTYTSFSVSWRVLLYSGFFGFFFGISAMSHHGNHGRSSATWGSHLFCAEFHPGSTHVFSFAQMLLILILPLFPSFVLARGGAKTRGILGPGASAPFRSGFALVPACPTSVWPT